jgi:hypothetical protein
MRSYVRKNEAPAEGSKFESVGCEGEGQTVIENVMDD